MLLSGHLRDHHVYAITKSTRSPSLRDHQVYAITKAADLFERILPRRFHLASKMEA